MDEINYDVIKIFDLYRKSSLTSMEGEKIQSLIIMLNALKK